jgi:hypothetical protein
VAQVRAREPAGSTPAGFAVVGRGDPLMLVLLFKATAAHRRSNLLSRSIEISHIAKAPGLLSPPGAETSTRAGL